MNSRNTLKKRDENRFLKGLLLSICLFALLTIVIILASHYLNLYEEFHEPQNNILFFNMQMALALASSVLLIVLMAQYLENFLRFRTNFTLAFVIMALVLLAHSITSNPVLFSYFGYEPMEGPFSIIPLIFTLIAALALLYLNRQ